MTCFADNAQSVVTEIVENVPIARNTMRLRVSVPRMARAVVPGQFFMIRNPAANDPLIGRAFALFDVDPDAGWLDVVYLVKGKLTSSLVHLAQGASLSLWGPLGNGFSLPRTAHVVMVAGGIGQTPFLTLAKEMLGRQHFDRRDSSSTCVQRVSLCYGVRSSEYLAGVDLFRDAGVEVHVATEDGSIGPPQRVTDLLSRILGDDSSVSVVCCGPEPMMEAVARLTAERGVECLVSLETPMACGIGICFSCVAKVGTPSDWDYKRTCVEGPVFNARDIIWH